MSIATLLSQHNQVTAVDIIPEKVDLINNRKSPIQDDYIEKYLAEKDLNLTATLDAKAANSCRVKLRALHQDAAQRKDQADCDSALFRKRSECDQVQ